VEFEFLQIIEGGCIFNIEDREYVLKKGDCVFIGSNCLHSAQTLENQPCSFYAFVFHPFLISGISDELYEKYITPCLNGTVHFPALYTENTNWHKELLNLMYELRAFYAVPPEQCELLVHSYVLRIWDLLWRHPISIEKVKKHTISEPIQKAIDYIQANHAQDISLITLSETVSLSVSHFCRLFKQETGTSAFTYLVRYRILKSCSLLMYSQYKIAVISGMVGFNNISNYNRFFRDIIGCTPSEYRNEHFVEQ